MPTEILDIVVRQKGARKVARDIAQIGIAATSSRNALRGLQTSLGRTQQAMTKAKASTQAATGALRGLGAAGVGAKRSLTALGTGVALVGGTISAALLKPLKGAINAAADFEQAMNLTGVLTQVDRTSAAFTEMSNKAKDLGLTTQFTATQAAQGMQFLAKAGFEAKDVIDSIEPSLNLAAAANVGMAEAADIATNIIRGYQQTVEDLPRAIDILAAAFTSSNTDIQELSKAFRDAGPIAVRFGQRFEDTAAAISALADAGIKSQKAGIALRRIMINLTKDSTKTNSVLREIGVNIYEIGADGVQRIRPIQDIFMDIASSSATSAQRIDLFGARALAASGILDDASINLEDFADKIANSVGRAAEVGSARLQGFRGAMTLLNSALEGLGIAIAESGLLDFMKKIVDAATSFVRVLADLPKPIKSVIGALLSILTVVSLLTLKFGLLIIAIAVLKSAGFPGFITILGKATTAIKAFSVALLTNPIGLVIVAIGALIAILYALRNETLTWGDQVFTVGDLVVATWDAIVEAVIYAWEWWGKIFGDIGAAIKDFGINLKSVLRFIQSMVNALIGLIVAIGRVVISAFKVVAKPLAAFISSVVDQIRNIPNLVKGAFSGEDILKTITAPFIAAIDEVKIEGKDLAADLGDYFTRDWLGDAGQGLMDLLGDLGIVDAAAARFLERLKKRQAAARGDTKPDGTGRPPPGTVPPPSLGADEIKARSEAYVELIKSLLDLTSAEEQLREAEITLRKAVEAGITTAQQANDVYQYLALQTFRDLENELFPVNAALKEQNDKLRELTRVAEAAGISAERLAKAQAKVRENFEKSVIATEEYQKSLTTLESLQSGLVEGVNQFGESLGTAFSNIADLTESTLTKTMDAIHEFVTTGKFDFRQFALEIIADIQKVILKLLALQALGAFKARGEFGGGVSGFVKALGGDYTGFDRFSVPGVEEKAKELAGLGTDIGTPTNPLFTIAANTEDKPLEARLSDPEMPALVNLRDTLKTTLEKNNTLNIDKITETNSILNEILMQVQTQGLGGGGLTGGIGDTTDAVNRSADITAEGLGGVIHSGQTNADQMQQAIGYGADDTVGAVSKSSREIVSAIVAGRGGKASTAYTIVSILSKVVGAVAGGMGGGGAGAAASAAGTIAGGAAGTRVETIQPTPMQAGGRIASRDARSSFLVGERGPELFTPGRAGAILPNDLLAAMNQPPELKVQVINVDDPTSIPEAMGTREGEKAVLNVIQRNRGRLREILA